jgi:hypothetical protein
MDVPTLKTLVQVKTITTTPPRSEMRYDILYEEGFTLVKDHLLWITDTLLESDLPILKPETESLSRLKCR